MFIEYWLEHCSVCLDDKKEIYFVNQCLCVDLVCRECNRNLNKCPFCRKVYLFGEPVEDFFVVKSSSDVVSGVSVTLTTQQAHRAKMNWNYWFHRFNGPDVMRPHVGLMFNHDVIHLKLYTGYFNRHAEAGICVDKKKAYTFVYNQLSTFCQNNGTELRYFKKW